MKTHAIQIITTLTSNEVFVFGSNASGFHGAGSAGYAFKGTSGNDWRDNPRCKAAIAATRTPGTDPKDRVGNWTIWGQARGHMKGTIGQSYAIVTTERPGHKGNVTLNSIRNEVKALVEFAKAHPELKFLCSAFGLSRAYGGFSWFTLEEMRSLFADQEGNGGMPDNVLIPTKFA